MPLVMCMVLYWVRMSTEDVIQRSWWRLPLDSKAAWFASEPPEERQEERPALSRLSRHVELLTSTV